MFILSKVKRWGEKISVLLEVKLFFLIIIVKIKHIGVVRMCIDSIIDKGMLPANTHNESEYDTLFVMPSCQYSSQLYQCVHERVIGA